MKVEICGWGRAADFMMHLVAAGGDKTAIECWHTAEVSVGWGDHVAFRSGS